MVQRLSERAGNFGEDAPADCDGLAFGRAMALLLECGFFFRFELMKFRK
jgi:hypothetical protein